MKIYNYLGVKFKVKTSLGLGEPSFNIQSDYLWIITQFIDVLFPNKVTHHNFNKIFTGEDPYRNMTTSIKLPYSPSYIPIGVYTPPLAITIRYREGKVIKNLLLIHKFMEILEKKVK